MSATMKSGLVLAICLLGLASVACSPVPASPDLGPTQSAEPWEPSQEWLDLYRWDQDVRAMRTEMLQEEDRDRQLELYDEFVAARQELQDYFVENPQADAPCATRVRYAQPEQWCSAQQNEFEQIYQTL
jgi:hypothetical protein